MLNRLSEKLHFMIVYCYFCCLLVSETDAVTRSRSSRWFGYGNTIGLFHAPDVYPVWPLVCFAAIHQTILLSSVLSHQSALWEHRPHVSWAASSHRLFSYLTNERSGKLECYGENESKTCRAIAKFMHWLSSGFECRRKSRWVARLLPCTRIDRATRCGLSSRRSDTRRASDSGGGICRWYTKRTLLYVHFGCRCKSSS